MEPAKQQAIAEPLRGSTARLSKVLDDMLVIFVDQPLAKGCTFTDEEEKVRQRAIDAMDDAANNNVPVNAQLLSACKCMLALVEECTAHYRSHDEQQAIALARKAIAEATTDEQEKT